MIADLLLLTWMVRNGSEVCSAATTVMGIKIDFKAVGEPTPRMIKCMTWILESIEVEESVEDLEPIWYDFNKAGAFISKYIDVAKESQISTYGCSPFDDNDGPWYIP